MVAVRGEAVRTVGTLLLIAIGLGAWGAGCAKVDPIEPLSQTAPQVSQNVVSWATDRKCLGYVRFGTTTGWYDRVAYPMASGRKDITPTRDHRVPLLGLVPGATYHVQCCNLDDSGEVLRSQEFPIRAEQVEDQSPLLYFIMIDVGFGDAHLLIMPTTGKRILVDAGERFDGPNVIECLREFGVDRLDAAYATHIHVDHIGGFVGGWDHGSYREGVLDVFPVGLFLDSPDKSAERPAYEETLEKLDQLGVPVHVVEEGQTDDTNPDLDWDPEVTVQVLRSGYGKSAGGEYENDHINNDSIVIRLAYGDVDIIIGGDAEGGAEGLMVSTQGSKGLNSEVLKIHHHGKADATSSPFLSVVAPRVALIPMAFIESWYDTDPLPEEEVLAKLEVAGCDIYANDMGYPLPSAVGDDYHHTVVLTDGRSYQVNVVGSLSMHHD